MSADVVEDGRREAAEDRRIARLFRQRRNREATLRRAEVTEDLVAEVEALRAARAAALRTLGEFSRGMTDDAYDALRSDLAGDI